MRFAQIFASLANKQTTLLCNDFYFLFFIYFFNQPNIKQDNGNNIYNPQKHIIEAIKSMAIYPIALSLIFTECLIKHMLEKRYKLIKFALTNFIKLSNS